MKHFSHEHPLIILNEVPKRDRVRAYCGGCGFQIVSGPFYWCEQCPFFNLHKFCAELPNEMKHPWHPEHPLTLDTVPLDYSCKACNFNRRGSLAYQCEPCKFRLHLECASLMLKIEREFHPHPLIPLLQPASFVCHACGEDRRGVSYKCTSCSFWVHESCASTPTSIKHSDHHHTITRAYRLERFGTFIFCAICQKDMEEMDWFYQCLECRYYAHQRCATSQKDSSRDEEIRNEDSLVLDPNMIFLPVPDESTYLITSFLKRMGVIKMENQLNHLGHHHKLTLFDEQMKDELFPSKCNLCEACVKPIVAPFYGCISCRYFLHKCCAKLPTQIREHPFHPEHPLDLLTKAPKHFGQFRCYCCNKRCNGFSFKCARCQDFYLDVKCGSLLGGPIKHESHKHILTPITMSFYNERYDESYDVCWACECDLYLRDPVFKCDECEFIVHSKCAILPISLKHRYDKHPFILNYSPIKGHPPGYYCEICEEEMDPRRWFYNCVKCDHSIHPSCNEDQFSNVKFGACFKVEGHQHPLTFIQFKNENGSLCNHCGKRLHEYLSLHPGFECRSCEFKLHLECARGATKRE